MLQFELRNARVLDLFAGSGQMGLEALSRGAEEAVFCDASRDAARIVEKNLIKTRLALQGDVLCMDYEKALQGMRRRKIFDLVFLDPPYAAGLLPSVLRTLLDKKLLSTGATVVAECGDPKTLFGGDEALAASYIVEKEKRYGAAYVYFLTPCEVEV
jgi:16S rRNA (guanine966-N2)-methyltransferase